MKLLLALVLISCGKYENKKNPIHVRCYDYDSVIYEGDAISIEHKGIYWIIKKDNNTYIRLIGECIEK